MFKVKIVLRLFLEYAFPSLYCAANYYNLLPKCRELGGVYMNPLRWDKIHSPPQRQFTKYLVIFTNSYMKFEVRDHVLFTRSEMSLIY
jgi:hypothetical protein